MHTQLGDQQLVLPKAIWKSHSHPRSWTTTKQLMGAEIHIKAPPQNLNYLADH